jgi:hypothetical protein
MAETHDVTEFVGMRQTLSQREKMDSIGELAGGIAHDFNKMLSGIIVAYRQAHLPRVMYPRSWTTFRPDNIPDRGG